MPFQHNTPRNLRNNTRAHLLVLLVGLSERGLRSQTHDDVEGVAGKGGRDVLVVGQVGLHEVDNGRLHRVSVSPTVGPDTVQQ